jgi:signal peptidase I
VPDPVEASPAELAGTPGSAPVVAEPKKRRLSRRSRNLLEWVVVLGGALVLALLLRTFVFQTFYIPSESMVPTLQVGDRLIVNKLADDVSRTDIVVFKRPETWTGPHDDLIKRVMGLEGETIEAHDNTVFIDGERIDEPYLPPGTITSDFGPETVPEGHMFVMGDNRQFSSDSRPNGPVPVDLVVGRAVIRIWPLSDIGGL